jgi:hypothetical protein
VEKGGLDRLKWPKGIPQGLKPIHFIGLIGTTEVVPCYKALKLRVFPHRVKPIDFVWLSGTTEVVAFS